MSENYNIVAETNEDTVVAAYEPSERKATQYQSEAALEREFIEILKAQGFEYLPLHSKEELVNNLRKQLERLNKYTFSEQEWEQFFGETIAPKRDGILEKTSRIQKGDGRQELMRDDGRRKNITLIDKKDIHNNWLQVINQYEVRREDGANYDNRYDVTVLVNGLPMVHVELKRRGVQLREAFNQISRYRRDSFWAGSGLFEYVQVFVISNGTHTKYYSNTTRSSAAEESTKMRAGRKSSGNTFEFTSFWTDARNHVITDLEDFARTFFARHTLLNVLTKYCVFTAEQKLLVMRPYQIAATEKVLNRIQVMYQNKLYGKRASGGYIWHTTGSGKTLTSFKCSQLASELDYIDKVLFVVDRKDLDYQTMNEYDSFEKGCANSNASSSILEKQLKDKGKKILITTIQKLSCLIRKNKNHEAFKKHTVFIFDECHRSQFGEMHAAIAKHFKNYYMFGFTGTPIFAENAAKSPKHQFFTTEQLFGQQWHSYTIVDAINDKNVLPFRIDYIMTMDREEDLDDEAVWDINREEAYLAPERVKKVTEYILTHYQQKTYGHNKSYKHNVLTNVNEVAKAKPGKVAERIEKKLLNGFNSIFAVSSVKAARLYYDEFQRQMQQDPSKSLRIATIFSFAPNEEEIEGILDEEEPENPEKLDSTSREFLERAIGVYNRFFNTNYDTSSENFQNYYKDVSFRMKNRELDMLIVVNMFLTGFDAKTLNTLWVDKNLKAHGLIQAFSRTNRILNSIKVHGNIVCFRPLRKRVDKALSLFGNKDAKGIVLLRPYEDYFNGYDDEHGKHVPGYTEILKDIGRHFPLPLSSIMGEEEQRKFISLFGTLLRLRNLLVSYDRFTDENDSLKDPLNPRDFQDYLGTYQDLRDAWRNRGNEREKADITDDLVFETELVGQVDINIDYILRSVQKYRDANDRDADIRIDIGKAVNASLELRSKKELIEAFIDSIHADQDVGDAWQKFITAESRRDLDLIISEEGLNRKETYAFMARVLAEGELKRVGTDIDEVLPPLSRRGGVYQRKKQIVFEKFQTFVEKYRALQFSLVLDSDEQPQQKSATYNKYEESDVEAAEDVKP